MGDSTVNQPAIIAQILSADTKSTNAAQKVLMVLPKLAAGTAVSGELQENINADKSIWRGLFGNNGLAFNAIDAFKKINKSTWLDVIALDSGVGATAASGTVTFSGTATDDGIFTVSVCSARDYEFEVELLATDTATIAGDKLVALITANTDIPVSAVNSTGVVTITALDLGSEGDSLTLLGTGAVAGLTLSVTAFSGGTLASDTVGVFDVVGATRYQTVVYPDSFDLSEMTDFLEARWPANKAITDGQGIVATVGTHADLLTLGNSVNLKTLCIFGQRRVTVGGHQGSALVEINIVRSSRFAALRALRLTAGEPIAHVVTATYGALDSLGGPAIASFPYFNTPIATSSLVARVHGFDDTEQEQLKAAGISFEGNNSTYTSLLLDEVVTTYKTDPAGNQDITFKYLNYVDTGSNIREYMFNNQKKRYTQSRLTNGDLIGGRTMANESSIRAYLVELYSDLSGEDFVLTQAGEDALQFFKGNMVVTVDLATGTVTETFKTPIVTQLRNIFQTQQIAFSITE